MPAKKKTTLKPPSEHQIQCACIKWCDLNGNPDTKKIFAIPNGGNRSAATGAMLKREGVRSGVPDLMLPVARNGFHGLFIEMKNSRKSKPSKEQIGRLYDLMSDGYDACIVYSLDHFVNVVKEYLQIP